MKRFWFLFYAWRQLFPQGKRASFFTYLSILGVSLGVAVLWIVLAVMDGMQMDLMKKIRFQQGDLRVDAQGQIIYSVEEVQTLLRHQKGVADVFPYAEGVVMMEFQQRPIFPFVKAVDFSDVRQREHLQQYLDFSRLESESTPVFVGEGLQKSLEIQVGDNVTLYSPQQIQSFRTEEVELPLEGRIAGSFRFKMNSIDQHLIIIPMPLMEELYRLNGGVHGFEIFLKEGYSSEDYARFLNEVILPPELRAHSWQELNQDFLSVLNMERTVMVFVLLFILLMAVFSISSSLLFHVVKKKREIAFLTTLGASQKILAITYTLQGFLLGFLGSILGFIFGGIALYFRNGIMRGVMLLFSNATESRFYEFTQLPVYISGMTLVFIFLGTCILTSLAGGLPALKILKMNPSEALRYE